MKCANCHQPTRTSLCERCWIKAKVEVFTGRHMAEALRRIEAA